VTAGALLGIFWFEVAMFTVKKERATITILRWPAIVLVAIIWIISLVVSILSATRTILIRDIVIIQGSVAIVYGVILFVFLSGSGLLLFFRLKNSPSPFLRKFALRFGLMLGFASFTPLGAVFLGIGLLNYWYTAWIPGFAITGFGVGSVLALPTAVIVMFPVDAHKETKKKLSSSGTTLAELPRAASSTSATADNSNKSLATSTSDVTSGIVVI